MKIVIEEPESPALRRFLAKEAKHYVSSALLRTEALRAVRHQEPEVTATVRDALRRIDLVAIDDRILDAAGVLEPAVVRTLDAIHLATALAIGDDLVSIITYDARMLESARFLGLRATDPQ